MATSIQTLNELDELFADHIQEMLGLQPEQVRIGYSETGQLAPKYNETVIYVHTHQEDDDVDRYINTNEQKELSGKFDVTVTAMRRLTLDISVYGADCDVMAIKIRQRMFHESSRLFFEEHNLALISNRTTMNNKIHELVNDRWWERVDLKIGLYNSVSVGEEVDPFEETKISITADDIQIVIGG